MNPVRNKKLKIFANSNSSWISNGMKKLFILISLLLIAHGAAAAVYVDPYNAALSNQAGTLTPNSSWVSLTPTNQLQQFQAQQKAGSGNLNYTPLEPFYAYESADINTNNFASIFNNIFKLLIAFGALVAVVTMVIGGVMYMTSEATGTKAEAKKRMLNSVYGLVLLAASYLILSTINPQLLTIKLAPETITGNQTPITTSQQQNAALTNATQADITDCEIGTNGQVTGRHLFPLSTGGFECR
ncbi:MAG: pilin [Patescibacteria group bacterium]